MRVIRNAEVIAVRDTIPDAFCDRKRSDLAPVAGVIDNDAAFAVSGNGRPDHDVSLAGMLRARPRRLVGSGAIRRSLPRSTNLKSIESDARGNLMGDALPGMGDIVDAITSRPVLLIAALAGWYFMLHPEKIPWRKKA